MTSIIICGNPLETLKRQVEVLFLDMEPEDSLYVPLIGYIILEQSQAAVDMLGHRLIHVKKADLK